MQSSAIMIGLGKNSVEN